MDDQERKMLERVLKLSEDNNRMLRSMRRAALVSKFVHLLYWIVIIGISVVSYYYIKPYIDSVYSALQTVERVNNFMPR